jgi:hypothetical protein
MKLRRVQKISLTALVLAIALMALPLGVRMNFVYDPGPPMEFVTFYFSYFSLTPLGYANRFPMITAVLTIAILVLLLIGFKKDTRRGVLICTVICIAASAISWLIFGAFSVVGLIVLLLHVGVFLLQAMHRKSSAGIV